ncbi:bacterioferritin [Pseudobacteriovorax antillogorgiicola]|uniref:Bacterioferritin n=1 Tax=Pseudobacteriovorax antillogorgiicola TaxID=1513793 RepID=A0A1Y6BDH7_9BACT|nr:bacterioferritin [Pseudobacteriovorax antillogorgiicola]SME98003.1 bacterioferritin [Pseudobacteriovorax antillogorgiicola]
MKGEQDVIKGLNEVLTGQLTAINQYFLHARMLKDWGYEKIAKPVYKESIRQMKVAEKVTDRILLLEGLPNYQKLLKLSIGESAIECLGNDLKFCSGACQKLAVNTKLCLDKLDHVSRELLEDIEVGEQKFLLWLETQQYNIKELGPEKYLAEQL